MWNTLHNLPVQPNIRMFIWRTSSAILPIGKNLMKRGLYKHTSSLHCDFYVEDDKYVLFDCQISRAVWHHIPKGSKWLQISVLNFKDFFYSIQLTSSKEVTIIFATTIWLIWSARNRLNYEGVRPKLLYKP